MYKIYFESPIGLLEIICNEKAVLEIYLADQKNEEKINPICKQTKAELESYFKGNKKTFNLPLKLTGTSFQNKVWQELLKLSFGEIISYQELANRIHNPKGVRAVARAVGANKILIIIPCHRIIGSNKTLTGFAAGLKNKIKLLSLEGHKINIKDNYHQSTVEN